MNCIYNKMLFVQTDWWLKTFIWCVFMWHSRFKKILVVPNIVGRNSIRHSWQWVVLDEQDAWLLYMRYDVHTIPNPNRKCSEFFFISKIWIPTISFIFEIVKIKKKNLKIIILITRKVHQRIYTAHYLLFNANEYMLKKSLS